MCYLTFAFHVQSCVQCLLSLHQTVSLQQRTSPEGEGEIILPDFVYFAFYTFWPGRTVEEEVDVLALQQGEFMLSVVQVNC